MKRRFYFVMNDMKDEALKLFLFFQEKRGELVGLKPKTEEQMLAIADLIDYIDKRIDTLAKILKDVEQLEEIDFAISI